MASEEERILLKIQAEVDAAEDIEALVDMIQLGKRDSARLSESIDQVAREVQKLSKAWGVSANSIKIAVNSIKGLDQEHKIVLNEAVKYLSVLERINAQQSKMSQRVAEIEVLRAETAFANAKAQKEREAEEIQQRKLALENAELATYQRQLAELQKMAILDAQALERTKQQNRTEAVPIASPQAALAIQKIREAESGLLDVSTPLNEKQKQLGQTLAELDNHSQTASRGLNRFINTIKGTLTAMMVFYTTQPLIEFFSSALKAATDFRKAFASLSFAESILSQRGMDITRQELDDIVKDIEEKYKYLGTLEVTGIVSTVADMGAEFNLTKEQITGLADAVAFLQLKEQAYGQEVSDVGSIVNAALDGRSNFFNRLGINITKTAIAEKAYAMGLAEQGAQLTKEQSNQAAIALLIEQTTGKYDELIASIEQVNPALANQIRITKEMKDSHLEVGNSILDVKDAWNEFLSALIERGDFDRLKDGLISFIEALGDVIGLFTSMYHASKDLKDSYSEFGGELADTGSKLGKWISPANAVLTFLQLLFLGYTTVVGAIVTAMGILSEFFAYASGAKTYEEAGRAVGEHFSNGLLDGIAIGLRPLVAGKDDAVANSLRQTMELLGKDISTPTWPDTPTGTGGGIEDDQSNLQNALEKMNTEILEAQIKLGQDMEEAAIDLGRKLVDIAEEYAQKRAEAEIDYTNKVRDINAEYAETISDIANDEAESNAKARNDELEREAEFQNKMLELKENYLMDLEDALHERDARQVLRLMRQYNLDKTQATREFNLEKQNTAREEALRRQEFARKRTEAAQERNAKLAEAQREYQDKLLQLQMEEEAEKRAAQIAYERKMQDLQREMHNRLSLVAASLVQEFNLTKQGLDAIYSLYKTYYGAIAQVYAAMNTMLAGQSRLLASGMSVTGLLASGMSVTGGGIITNTTGNRLPIIGTAGQQRFAEGGMMVADRPTTVTFGEAGLEMAQFAPIGKNGRDVNKLFTNLSGVGGGGESSGQVGIDISLSDGLEARITQNTLDEAGKIVTKILGSKTR